MDKSSIGDALFTKTQQRVLSLLYGKPEQSFYLNELVRLAGVGKGAVSRELAKLTEAGLLTMVRQGNQSHYQANAANPVFVELKTLIQKTVGVTDIVKAALTSLLTRLDQAFIYGSVAKGSENAGSDIDVMLVGDDLSYGEVMEQLEGAEQQLGRKINPTLLTPGEFSSRIEAGQSFLTRVMEQPKFWLKQP
jgi:DNA-binding transcriptional ArsR family regulator